MHYLTAYQIRNELKITSYWANISMSNMNFGFTHVFDNHKVFASHTVKFFCRQCRWAKAFCGNTPIRPYWWIASLFWDNRAKKSSLYLQSETFKELWNKLCEYGVYKNISPVFQRHGNVGACMLTNPIKTIQSIYHHFRIKVTPVLS